ncbi:MAG: sarcosine oxidase subunit gamma [Alphaproteobacteria bacterium]
MAELRKSPLDGVMQPGRFGAGGSGTPGVVLSVRAHASSVAIIARNGQAQAVSAALVKHFGTPCPAVGYSATGKGLSVHWAGADQWLVVAAERKQSALFNDLATQLSGLASVSDQSHGRIIIAVSGPRARDVLAKGTPVDLHARVFGVGQCALTQMAHIGIHLAQVGRHDFEVSLFRGFGISFWEWLTEMSREFGYQVT